MIADFSIWLAVVLTGIIFGAVHFLQSGFNLMFVLSATILTVFLALSRPQTQAIWWAIGWHAGWKLNFPHTTCWAAHVETV